MGRNLGNQEEKMQQILESTMEVISRETISGTRMHLIAKEAGVSQSILHYYFKSKEDILVHLLQDLQKKFNIHRTELIDPVNKSLEENVEGFFAQKKDIIWNKQKMDVAQFDFFVQCLVDDTLHQTFREFFEVWHQAIVNVIRTSDIPEQNKKKLANTVSRMMISLMMGASMQYLVWNGQDFDLDEYFSLAQEIIVQCLRQEGIHGSE